MKQREGEGGGELKDKKQDADKAEKDECASEKEQEEEI